MAFTGVITITSISGVIITITSISGVIITLLITSYNWLFGPTLKVENGRMAIWKGSHNPSWHLRAISWGRGGIGEAEVP